jgi:hypothetical protein
MTYTHRDHAALCGAAGRAGVTVSGLHVQARIGRTICCAQIVTAWDAPDGTEMWQLDLRGPIHGRMSAPAHRVRQCGGLDGRCSCSPDALEGPLAGRRQAERAGPAAGPEGVTC